MSADAPEFKRGVVKPLECLRDGWQLIKDDYWFYLGISFVGILVGSLAPAYILIGPAICGIHLCLLRRERGLPVTFDMLFRGFDYFVPSLIAMLIMAVPMLIVSIFSIVLFCIGLFLTTIDLQQQRQGVPPDLSQQWIVLSLGGVAFILILVFSIVSSALYLFTFPLIVDREMSGFEAVRMSFKAARGNFVGVLGLVLLNVALSLLGVLACYVGAFLVMPIGFAMTAVAYRQVFPAQDSIVYIAQDPEFEEEPARRSDGRFRADN